jgi:hypothetical protein
MAAIRGVIMLIAVVLLVGCANKQILRNQAIMTKKLGAATGGLEQLAGSAVHDRRVVELMSFAPPSADARNAFLTYACRGDLVQQSVGQALGTYRRRLTELDNLATAPSDTSFAALVASMKKSSAARRELPDDDQAQALKILLEAREKSKLETQLSLRQCQAIVAYDLSNSADRKEGDGSFQAMGKGADTYLTLINLLRTGMSLAEQTMRANVVKDYTEKVLQPDLELALAYLASSPDVDPVSQIAANKDPFEQLPPPICTQRKGFMDTAGKVPEQGPPLTGDALSKQLESDKIIGFGQPHGRLAWLAAQARTTAVRQAYIHYALAQQLNPLPGSAGAPAQNGAILRLANDAADAMARADGLIGIDVDCDVLPKLATSQRQLSKAVVEGTGSADVADGFADALANLQSIQEALEKVKKAGW